MLTQKSFFYQSKASIAHGCESTGPSNRILKRREVRPRWSSPDNGAKPDNLRTYGQSPNSMAVSQDVAGVYAMAEPPDPRTTLDKIDAQVARTGDWVNVSSSGLLTVGRPPSSSDFQQGSMKQYANLELGIDSPTSVVSITTLEVSPKKKFTLVRSIKNSTLLGSFEYTRSDPNGDWQYNLGTSTAVIVTSKGSPELAEIEDATTWFTMMLVEGRRQGQVKALARAKKRAEEVKPGSSAEESGQSVRSGKSSEGTQGIPRDCPTICSDYIDHGDHYMFPHDYECTFPDIVLQTLDLWTDKGRYGNCFSRKIYYRLPCTGTIEIDVSECCRDHDIALWCAEDEYEAIVADTQVLICMTRKVWQVAMGKISGLCWLVDPFYLFANLIARMTIAQLGAFFAWAGHGENLFGKGKFADSCLCKEGGKPTFLCHSPCRNLCSERFMSQTCTNCWFECVYDPDIGDLKRYSNGSPVYVPRKADSSLPCCNNMAYRREYSYEGGNTAYKYCVDPPHCDKKNCTDCKWVCESCHIIGGKKKCPGDWTWRLDRQGGDKPCCPDTPGPQPGSADALCTSDKRDDSRDEPGDIGVWPFG